MYRMNDFVGQILAERSTAEKYRFEWDKDIEELNTQNLLTMLRKHMRELEKATVAYEYSREEGEELDKLAKEYHRCKKVVMDLIMPDLGWAHPKYNKVFEIGEPKTGTTSLGAAFKILGLKEIGWEEQAYETFLRGPVPDYKYLFDQMAAYEAFQDGPWHDVDFRILDMAFPGSKFIYLERDDESWIRSVEKHYSPEINANDLPARSLHTVWLTPDRDEHIRKRLEGKKLKKDSIIEYFKDRPDDLLIMNICEGEGWETLCPFLHKPTPKRKFPRANVASTGTPATKKEVFADRRNYKGCGIR
jgi:hypothetical protein